MGQREFPRQKRVAEEIRRSLARPLAELHAPGLGLVSITGVEVNKDYSEAKVFVSLLNSDDPAASMKTLNESAPHLRHELAAATAMRSTPRLRFVHDTSLEQGARIDELISRGLPRDDG